jgi:two-component system sensor kinase FixL
MYQVNMAAEKIFGYNKGELVNRKVNDIMPKLISFYHDRILENYQQTNKAKMMNKERVVWGKSKDGYLFTFVIIIKPVKNFLSQTS